MVEGDITFDLKVTLRLSEDEVRRVLAGRRRWEEDPKHNDHFDVLVEIFDNDDGLWEAYFTAAFDALAEKYPLKKGLED